MTTFTGSMRKLANKRREELDDINFKKLVEVFKSKLYDFANAGRFNGEFFVSRDDLPMISQNFEERLRHELGSIEVELVHAGPKEFEFYFDILSDLDEVSDEG